MTLLAGDARYTSSIVTKKRIVDNGLGSQVKLMQNRGQVQTSPLAERVVPTIHPSAVLRAPDSEGRRQAHQMLVDDLTVVARLLGKR